MFPDSFESELAYSHEVSLSVCFISIESVEMLSVGLFETVKQDHVC